MAKGQMKTPKEKKKPKADDKAKIKQPSAYKLSQSQSNTRSTSIPKKA